MKIIIIYLILVIFLLIQILKKKKIINIMLIVNLIPKSEKLRIICKLNVNLLNNYQQISLNKVEIAYNNYNIVISQQDFIEVEQ